MAQNTSIEWTDATWNPIRGCTRVSAGCVNCYAEVMAARFSKPGQWGEGLAEIVRGADGTVDHRWTGKMVRAPKKILTQPLRRKKPRRIFVNSTSDLFHEAVPDEWIDQVFAVMALTPQHTFQVLTKRPERMREYLSKQAPDGTHTRFAHIFGAGSRAGFWRANGESFQWPLPNVWLGVSAEDQATADARIPQLLATPAAIRFVSAEPLLGPVELDGACCGESALTSECWGECTWCDDGRPGLHNCWKGRQTNAEFLAGRSGLDWVIVGGESGPGARPMHPDWVRSLRDQCQAAGVPFFFKQWGEWRPAFSASEAGAYPILANNRPWAAKTDAERNHVFMSGVFRMPHQVESLIDGVGEYAHLNCAVVKVGKAKAGRLLDGCEWNEFPEQEGS